MDFLLKKYEVLNSKLVPEQFEVKNEHAFNFKWVQDVDTNVILSLRNAPHVTQRLPDSDLIKQIDHKRFLENYMDLYRIDFIIIDSLSGNAVGGLNLNETNIGYEIGKYIGDYRYLRRGIASEATKSFLRYIESHFSFLEYVYAKTLVNNTGNIRLNKRLGFHLDKHMGDYLLMKKRM